MIDGLGVLNKFIFVCLCVESCCCFDHVVLYWVVFNCAFYIFIEYVGAVVIFKNIIILSRVLLKNWSLD
jgi:hypothetical protein